MSSVRAAAVTGVRGYTLERFARGVENTSLVREIFEDTLVQTWAAWLRRRDDASFALREAIELHWCRVPLLAARRR